MNLTDTLQHWLQGQINASIDGMVSRLDRLESENNNLVNTNLALEHRMRMLEADRTTLRDLRDLGHSTAQRISALAERIDDLEVEENFQLHGSRLDRLECARKDLAGNLNEVLARTFRLEKALAQPAKPAQSTYQENSTHMELRKMQDRLQMLEQNLDMMVETRVAAVLETLDWTDIVGKAVAEQLNLDPDEGLADWITDVVKDALVGAKISVRIQD